MPTVDSRTAWAAWLGLCAFWLLPAALAQSATGTQGLIMTPTARMHPDGTLIVGHGRVDSRYSEYDGGLYDYSVSYASVTFLPFMEAGFRFSRKHSGRPEALGDRMLLARVRVLREAQWWPDVAVGAHDFLRSSDRQTSNFNALYAVASKSVPLPERLRAWGLGVDVHAGYGTDALSASSYQFVGPFGGVSATAFEGGSWISSWTVMAEYDGAVATVGQRVSLFRTVDVLTALQGFRVPLIALSARVSLKG